ncbi:MAG: gamma carbonic anhydrase family protein [Geminicoccaceae bacterium]|nr:gamma carbonic anhydrase family protein [Geminicoccaceae bacterium]
MRYALGDLVPTCKDENWWIAPNAAVAGDVRLGSQVSIWFGATLRGDNEPITIGDGTNIQDNCVLHTDPGFPLVIGENVTVGHMAVLHGCNVGSGTLIGMGAMVLNGAKVGENCLIGAKALIPEGKEIPPGSLVMGIPGKIVGQASTAQIEGIRRGVETYKKRFRLYREHLQLAE